MVKTYKQLLFVVLVSLAFTCSFPACAMANPYCPPLLVAAHLIVYWLEFGPEAGGLRLHANMGQVKTAPYLPPPLRCPRQCISNLGAVVAGLSSPFRIMSACADTYTLYPSEVHRPNRLMSASGTPAAAYAEAPPRRNE